MKVWPQGFAATLGALDRPFLVLADRQGERHITVALVAVVLVHWHSYPSCRFGNWIDTFEYGSRRIMEHVQLERRQHDLRAGAETKMGRLLCNKSFVRASLCSSVERFLTSASSAASSRSLCAVMLSS